VSEGLPQYSYDSFLRIERDATGLPRCVFRPFFAPPCFPNLQHHVGNGRLHVLVDAFGRCRVFTAGERGKVCVAGGAGDMGGLLVQWKRSGTDASGFGTFNGMERGTDRTDFVLCWSPGAVEWSGTADGDGLLLRYTVRMAVHPDEPWAVVEVRFTIETGAAPVIRVACVPALRESRPPAPFLRGRTAVLPAVGPREQDVFLVAPPGWRAGAVGPVMIVEQQSASAASDGAAWRFVIGCGQDCSAPWIEDVWEQAGSVDAVVAERVRRLGAPHAVRVPELSMRDERLWSEGRVQNFISTSPSALPPLRALGLKSETPDAPASTASTSDAWLRNRLLLAFPLAEIAAESCSRLLMRAAAVRSTEPGADDAMAKASGFSSPDIDAWLLAGWMWLLERCPEKRDVLDAEASVGGGSVTVWECLKRAAVRLKTCAENTPHGCVPLGSGDWNPTLTSGGEEGRGESVLTSALCVWAARRLVETAWRRGDEEAAGIFEAWRDEQALAVARAFDGAWFRRAWDASGRPIGTFGSDQLFADVQAWAVLARCGTPEQRRQALDAVLERCLDPCGIRVVSVFFSVPRADPPVVTDPPGVRWNGGVSVLLTAWTVWALCAERRRAESVELWRRMTVLQRAPAGAAGSIPPQLVEVSRFACAAESATPGLPEPPAPDGAGDLLPDVHAVAWQGFALRRLLEGRL